MNDSPTAAIIGASRGIGLELARQYLADGWRVHATVRSAKGRRVVEDLGDSLDGALVLHELDVRNAGQIVELATYVASEGIDVLIHNAGVYGKGMKTSEVMEINAHAPIEVAEVLLESVLRGEQKKIVLVTSQMGARQGSTRSLGTYGESKAALNDAFRERAADWGRRGVTAVVIHPGWVRTDMGGSGATLSAEESARGIRRVAANLVPQQHGRFLTWDGREHPW